MGAGDIDPIVSNLQTLIRSPGTLKRKRQGAEHLKKTHIILNQNLDSSTHSTEPRAQPLGVEGLGPPIGLGPKFVAHL